MSTQNNIAQAMSTTRLSQIYPIMIISFHVRLHQPPTHKVKLNKIPQNESIINDSNSY